MAEPTELGCYKWTCKRASRQIRLLKWYMKDSIHEYGAILMDPPYHAHAFDGALAVIYNAGTKENAGIFSQSQGWIILAEALKGHGDRAFKYFIENAPAAQNDRAEIRSWSRTAMDSLLKEKQARISDDLMCTG